MGRYTVLRDLTDARTGEPFGGAASLGAPNFGTVGSGSTWNS
jgi:hypothetical protein